MNETTKILLQTIEEAGSAILEVRRKGFSIERKANNDLVTQADLLANDILKKNLLTAFPDDGWLSEESVDDEGRLQTARVWVVDPIDGTIEFATGVPEFAVSVALVEHGKPILAAVFNPVTNELFHAVKGAGAWLGNKKIQCTQSSSSQFTLLASRSEYTRGEWDVYKNVHQVKEVGSIAYKLGLVAAGYADATFSLGPKSEWDIAAGVLIVQEAGGIATDKERQQFTFNNKKIRVDGIVATAAAVNEAVFELIQQTSC